MDIILDVKDYRCVWPDGDARTVRVHKVVDGMAWILWNEPHEPMPIPNPPGPDLISTMAGCDDRVPVAWLEANDN